jgi:hypothetical protein
MTYIAIYWTLLKPIAQGKKLPDGGKDRAWEGGQLPWARRGCLDEKPSNNGMKMLNCMHKAPAELFLTKMCATVKHYEGSDWLRTPHSRRWWTRMGNKVKREKLRCFYHELKFLGFFNLSILSKCYNHNVF